MAQDVSGGRRIHVQPNRPRIFCGAATYVQNARQIVSPVENMSLKQIPSGMILLGFPYFGDLNCWQDSPNSLAKTKWPPELETRTAISHAETAYMERSTSVRQASIVRTANSACSSSMSKGGQNLRVVSPDPRMSKPL